MSFSSSMTRHSHRKRLVNKYVSSSSMKLTLEVKLNEWCGHIAHISHNNLKYKQLHITVATTHIAGNHKNK